MNKNYTLMVVPSHNGKIRKIRIPRFIIQSAALLIALLTIVVGIMLFDYWKIFQEVYQNKHITQENKLLKEQMTLFKIKIETLSKELDRIHLFEKKLRVITGLEGDIRKRGERPLREQSFLDLKNFKDSLEFQKMREYYQKKISQKFKVSFEEPSHSFVEKLEEKTLILAEDFSQLDYQYGQVKKLMTEVEEDLHEIDEFVLEKKSKLQSTPTLLPANGWITSYFGPRMSPYAGKVKMHEGLDIGAPIGTDIIAPADGVVTFSGMRRGFGNFIKINHGYGLETAYAHAHKLLVRTGKKVKRGDRIAQVGNTGFSTGPHLHYEVHVNGIPVNPYYFILQ